MIMRCFNAVLHGAHLAIILFTTFGWIVPACRPAHLALCALTVISWFGLGIPLGKPGMCLVTEIQKAVWRRLGIVDRDSYMVYLVEQITGKPPDPAITDLVAQAVVYTSAAASLALLLV